MPARALRLRPSAADLGPAFDRIRRELRIPEAFPDDAEAEARAAVPATAERADRRDLELLSIDPAGSRDLDQAMAIGERPGGGHRVHYAIADVAALVAPGGAVDREAQARGVTIYLPDRRTPLHPAAIGEGSGSLLEGEDRPALLWTIDLGPDAEPVAQRLERAWVRNRRAMSYEDAQREIDAGSAPPTLRLLREVGAARLAREAERGGVSLSVPEQEVVRDGEAYALRYRAPQPVEDWNAQVSLLAGICAARIMIAGGLGLFRTLDPAEPRDLEALRRSALALGVPWPQGARYADVVRALDPRRPADAAFAVRAARLFHGAGYRAWRAADGEPPVHAAIAAPYAHVTAPLRRLADRATNEVVLALCAGTEPPPWAAGALPGLPALMASATGRERQAERQALDVVEAAVLAGRVGETFGATVVDVRDGRATVQLADPAVVGPLDDPRATAGERITVRLAAADPQERRVAFAPASG